MAVNYIIATWSGERNRIDGCPQYLQTHISQLQNLDHNLSQITIAVANNPHEPKDFKSFLRSLKQPYVVKRLPNEGMSYGLWTKIIKQYKQKFKYSILIEDDYVPIKSHFDSDLSDIYESLNCGYLCGLVLDRSGRFLKRTNCHAAISNGITSWDVFQHLEPPKHWQDYWHAQFQFSEMFTEKNYNIYDWLHKYQSSYWNKRYLMTYRELNVDQDLFVPIEKLSPKGLTEYIHWWNGKRKKIKHK